MSALAKLPDRFSEADIEEEIVIMRLDTGEFYALTGTGAAIWRLIDGSRTKGELIAILSAGFEGDPLQIGCDVDRFVKELERNGLVSNA